MHLRTHVNNVILVRQAQTEEAMEHNEHEMKKRALTDVVIKYSLS